MFPHGNKQNHPVPQPSRPLLSQAEQKGHTIFTQEQYNNAIKLFVEQQENFHRKKFNLIMILSF